MSEIMLAKQGSLADLNNKGFIFEPKFDGTRTIIYKKRNKIKLVNRRDINVTYRYPELNELWKYIKNDSVIDGELVILGKKHLPDFNLLQMREQLDNKLKINLLSKEHPATIFVFDILKLKERDLTKMKLLERKKILKQQIKDSSKIAFTPYVKDGKKLWKRIQKLKMEGVMAKKIDSKYERTRSSAWLKIKNVKTIEAIVIGYTREKRKISALALGAYHKGKLIYIGRAASGLDEKTINEFSRILCHSKHNIEMETRKKIFPVAPKIVVEIKYLEITKDLKLRAPVFLRIRNDKSQKECVI